MLQVDRAAIPCFHDIVVRLYTCLEVDTSLITSCAQQPHIMCRKHIADEESVVQEYLTAIDPEKAIDMAKLPWKAARPRCAVLDLGRKTYH